MNKRIKFILCAAAGLLALVITIYPLASNYFGERHMSYIQTKYTEAVESLDNTEITAARDAAKEYNATLNNVTDKAYSKEALIQASESYDAILNVRGDGIMGYIEIPKIEVNLPIYHGTEEKTLEHGTGHLLGSSLPIGGRGSHSVITGHSGLSGQKLFSDLERLRAGDVFYIHVLDSTLAYMVADIYKVLPEDTSKLTVDPIRDVVTLVTCTPYGVNTHRLLVRAERIEYITPDMVQLFMEEQEVETVTSTWQQQYVRGILIGLSLILLAVTALGGSWMVKAWKDYRNEPWQGKRGRHETY